MSSKAITETPEPDAPSSGEWKSIRELAPSVIRADEPTVPRWVGTIGLALVLLGTFVLLFNRFGRSTWIGPYPGSLAFILGIACLLYHAARDADLQVRRLYAFFGFIWLAAAIIMAVLPIFGGPATYFLPFGCPSLLLALVFLMPVARNETEKQWHDGIINVIGLVGLACAATGLIGGNINTNFLLSYGLLLSVIGLGYLWAFIALRGAADDQSHRVGWGVGVAGALSVPGGAGPVGAAPVVPLLRWISTQPTPHYLESSGVLLMMVGLAYVGLAGGLVSDNRFAVLTRRELAAFFFSPLAYIVLFGFAAIAAGQYAMFVGDILESQRAEQPMLEPIIAPYIFSLIPVFVMILVVPLLTMRLLSEEHRSGTLEVLLTSPVEEAPIVWSKFVAALIVFMVVLATVRAVPDFVAGGRRPSLRLSAAHQLHHRPGLLRRRLHRYGPVPVRIDAQPGGRGRADRRRHDRFPGVVLRPAPARCGQRLGAGARLHFVHRSVEHEFARQAGAEGRDVLPLVGGVLGVPDDQGAAIAQVGVKLRLRFRVRRQVAIAAK